MIDLKEKKKNKAFSGYLGRLTSNFQKTTHILTNISSEYNIKYFNSYPEDLAIIMTNKEENEYSFQVYLPCVTNYADEINNLSGKEKTSLSSFVKEISKEGAHIFFNIINIFLINIKNIIHADKVKCYSLPKKTPTRFEGFQIAIEASKKNFILY